MEANGSTSGPQPPRNAEAVTHPRPPVHPPVPPPRRSEVVLPPLETQQPPAGFRAVQPVSISLPASPGSFGVLTPPAVTTDSADLRRQVMANAARGPAGPHRLAARQDAGSNSVRFTQPDREAMMFRSQPIPGPPPASRAGAGAAAMNWPDRRYDSFKTWSGKLERQITHLAGGVGPDDLEDVGDVIVG